MSCSSWSDLPIDIIRTIAERLHYSAIIRFSAVCKTWWEATHIHGVKYVDKVPWLFGYNESSRSHDSFYLYDPFQKKQHTINKPPLILDSAKILASKDGWILFFKENSSIFFYSPFNNKIIELPPLIIGFQDKGIFSASPGCSHCVVFVVSITANYICISTCSPGDSTWTKHYYNGAYSDLHGITDMKGVLYCAFSFQLCAFNREKRDWKTIHLRNPIWIKQGHYSNDSSLIEADGNLFLIYYNGKGGSYNPNNHYCNSCNILRFDWYGKEWFGVEDLRNKLLFVGYDGHSSMLVSAVGEVSELANTVHFAGDTKERYACYSYCFGKRPRAHLGDFYGDRMVAYFEYRISNAYPQLYGWIEEQWSSKKHICLQPPQFETKATHICKLIK